MPIAEFTRAYYAMNKVLVETGRSLQLSPRATVVMLILSDAKDGEMRTSDLAETFRQWYVSGKNTAAKDVSIAKGELFSKDLIAARRGIRNIAFTDEGARLAAELVGAIESSLKLLVDGQKDLVLIQVALSSLKPKQPEKALSSVGVNKKPVKAEGDRSPLPHKPRKRA